MKYTSKTKNYAACFVSVRQRRNLPGKKQL